jgi:ribosomal protein S18 acetylase RimI-like enzyme
MTKKIFENWQKYLEEVEREDISIMPIDPELPIQEWEEDEAEEDEDYESAMDQAYKITNIRPSSSNELSFVAVDLNDNNKVYGAIYSGVSGDAYSFDLEVSPEAQGMGVASSLINEVMEQYEEYKEAYGDELKMQVHVVNKVLVNHLIKKGFEIVEESNGEWLLEFKE